MEKLSFNNLGNLTDLWLSDITDFEQTFHNQSEFIKKLVTNVAGNREKLENLANRLDIAKCIQISVDNNISLLEENEQRITKLIKRFEDEEEKRNRKYCQRDCNNSTATDVTRTNIYEMSGKIFVILHNYRQLLEDLTSAANENYEAISQENPFQSVTELLANDLNLLKTIEHKIVQLKTCLDNTSCLKLQVLRKLYERGVILEN